MYVQWTLRVDPWTSAQELRSFTNVSSGHSAKVEFAIRRAASAQRSHNRNLTKNIFFGSLLFRQSTLILEPRGICVPYSARIRDTGWLMVPTDSSVGSAVASPTGLRVGSALSSLRSKVFAQSSTTAFMKLCLSPQQKRNFIFFECASHVLAFSKHRLRLGTSNQLPVFLPPWHHTPRPTRSCKWLQLAAARREIQDLQVHGWKKTD